MAVTKIKLLGRARGGRCVFCHDDLRGDEARRCPQCHATWHPDCGASAPRCPTRGCAGPPPAERAATRRRGRRRAAPRAFRAWRGRQDGRPAAWPRFGPMARLVLSGLFHATLAAGLSALLATPIFDPGGFWSMLKRGKNGQVVPDFMAALKGLVMVALGLAFLWVALRWLWQLPSVWREVTRLLDETEPTLMFMTIHVTGTGKKQRTHARLMGDSGQADLTLQIDGILPPGWLKRHDQEPVLVYGLPPPGPYILEFEDGALALVHPD